MSSEKTVINMSLLIWCCVVVFEFCIIAYLIGSGLVLLFNLILISPILAAFKWPVIEQTKSVEVRTPELKTEKAE